ncbi:MAG: hypothetical protein ACK4F8_11690 [Aquabacterium sp.]
MARHVHFIRLGEDWQRRTVNLVRLVGIYQTSAAATQEPSSQLVIKDDVCKQVSCLLNVSQALAKAVLNGEVKTTQTGDLLELHLSDDQLPLMAMV